MAFDLEKRFGRQFVIEHDETGSFIPCRHGRIRRHDDGHLLVEFTTAGAVVDAVRLLWRAIVSADGKTATLPVAQVGKLAWIIHPVRRRRMAKPEQRSEAAARLRAYQFRPAPITETTDTTR